MICLKPLDEGGMTCRKELTQEMARGSSNGGKMVCRMERSSKGIILSCIGLEEDVLLLDREGGSADCGFCLDRKEEAVL